jgi:hypothetical protein
VTLDQLSGSDRELLRNAIARLRASVMATAFALTGGTGLFLATIWLVIRGGEMVGPHLGLLSNYFPGYSVTWAGAFVGFFYGALTAGIVGWTVAWIYNTVANRRAAA